MARQNPKPLTGDPNPSSTPRTGRRTWLRAPGGGRDWLGIDLDDLTRVVGTWAVSWRADGAVVRVDLSGGASTVLARVPRPEQGSYRDVALSADGAHWAVTDGQNTTVDGSVLTGELSDIVFGADGESLWGFRGQRVVKLDLRGAVLWEGAERGSKLAIAGDAPVVGLYAGVRLPDRTGTFVSARASHAAEPRLLLVDDTHAVLLFWLQHEGTWCWRASVFSLGDPAERTFTLPGCDGTATLWKGVLVWLGGELDLGSGALTTFEVPALGSTYAEKRLGGIAVSPDGQAVWQLLLDAMTVRRLRRADRGEAPRPTHHKAEVAWSLAVSSRGMVAVGTDDGWVLYGEDGQTLHERHDGQAVQLSFSPDGARLAVATSEPSLAILDVMTLETLVRAERSVSALAFLPDGARLLLIDDIELVVVGADDLQSRAVLKGKGPMLRAAVCEGSIVSADESGRAYLFDDPGPLPPSKKAPKHAPRVLFPSPELGSWEGAVLELSAGHLVVSSEHELRALDARTRKVVASVEGEYMGGDGIVAVRAGDGVNLFRLGERAPFATLEGMPERIAATPDGRYVAVALHRGLLRWTEEAGRTPASKIELVLPEV